MCNTSRTRLSAAFTHPFLWTVTLLFFTVTPSCGPRTTVRPAPLPAAPATKSFTFHARSEVPLPGGTMVGIRWSSILFEDRDAITKAFPDRPVFELLTPQAAEGGFTFTLTPPPPDRHVFSGLCAGFGDEMCTDPKWKATEAKPLYALGVLALVSGNAGECTFNGLPDKTDACRNLQPLAVSRFMLMYVYESFSPARDPFMSSKWPWTLPATLTPGFHVIEYRGKRDSRAANVDVLEFSTEESMPNLF